jgi:hypothetical protein
LLGSILEPQNNAKYGDLRTPKTLDGAAKQALQGWVSVP